MLPLLPPVNLPPLTSSQSKLAALSVPVLPMLEPLRVGVSVGAWRRSPDVNPTVPGWYVTRWRAEHPEARLYWDGVWWCRADADGVLHQLQHQNIKNWSCEWK